jgi:hypothetical protein
MIRYALQCDRDHGFESWFHSAEAFDTLRAGGHLSCPDCGSVRVDKALMAPQVRPTDKAAAPTPDEVRKKTLAELKKQVEENSEYVGMEFVTEARRIHEGEAPERSIYGEARVDEAKKLIEDGVPVAPLPFLPTRKAN